MSYRQLRRAYYANKKFEEGPLGGASQREQILAWYQNNKEEIDKARKAGFNERIGKIFSGRGAYSVAKFNRDFKSLVPRSIRRAAENRIAGAISGSGMYSGRGEYQSNALVDDGRPSMDIVGHQDETQSITISHTEYLQDIYGAPSSAFTVESWKLNPGLMENFPWLAQVSSNYEEYEFVQLLFHFKSTVDPSATNNSSGATGTLIMATNYNPTAANFTSKEVMMQYHGSNSGRLTDDHCHGVECDPEKNAGSAQKYVRTTPVVVGQDPKTFDLGTFQLAQVNIPSAFQNQQVGELWVTYTVRLTKPRLFSALGSTILENRWVSNGGETAGNVMGTNVLTMQQNALGITLSYPASGSYMLTFPDYLTGVYEILFLVEASGGFGATTWNATTTTGSVVAWNDIYGSAVNTTDNPSNGFVCATATGANQSQCALLSRWGIQPVTSTVDNTITMSLSIGSGTPTQSQLIVRQVNPSLGQSSSNPAPYYVNSLGVVTNPPA